MTILMALLLCFAQAPPTFRAQELSADFGIGYAVLVADINRDSRPDVVAINPTQVVWFENPSWQPHVISDGATRRDNVCIAACDIDGDGWIDLAVGADWKPSNTTSGGTLQWIGRGNEGPSGLWRLFPIGEEPTLHRIRWGDIDGDGRSELIAAPLHGRGTRGPDWQGQGARILVFRIPKDPVAGPWTPEVADDTLHIVHNFTLADLDGDRSEEILTASREGVHRLRRQGDGSWLKTLVGEGAPGEIKLGRAGGRRLLATAEPWHGSAIVVYEEQPGLWKRQVIEEQLAGAHALGWGDFDGDGSDDLAAGWRDKEFGLAIYRRAPDGSWSKTPVDIGGMATEDLAVADLNGDGRPEIIAVGRATHNVKIYWNEK